MASEPISVPFGVARLFGPCPWTKAAGGICVPAPRHGACFSLALSWRPWNFRAPKKKPAFGPSCAGDLSARREM
jgi:hypothetical protein